MMRRREFITLLGGDPVFSLSVAPGSYRAAAPDGTVKSKGFSTTPDPAKQNITRRR